MKYAFTLVHHHGQNGNAPEGRILRVSEDRFREIGPEGLKLVREATKEEVEAGWQPPFEKDATQASESGEADAGEKQQEKPKNKQAPAPANKAAD